VHAVSSFNVCVEAELAPPIVQFNQRQWIAPTAPRHCAAVVGTRGVIGGELMDGNGSGSNNSGTSHDDGSSRSSCPVDSINRRSGGGDWQHDLGGQCLPELLMGADPLKDQSYFLASVDARQLVKSWFPIGEGRTKTSMCQDPIFFD